jgi:hypothetical protein
VQGDVQRLVGSDIGGIQHGDPRAGFELSLAAQDDRRLEQAKVIGVDDRGFDRLDGVFVLGGQQVPLEQVRIRRLANGAGDDRLNDEPGYRCPPHH